MARKYVSAILQIAHDSKLGRYFNFAKTMSRGNRFHCRHKSRDMKKYVEGLKKCQQFKRFNQEKMIVPQTLETPEYRWGLLATDFIVRIPKKDGYDASTIRVDLLKRGVNFIKRSYEHYC